MSADTHAPNAGPQAWEPPAPTTQTAPAPFDPRQVLRPLPMAQPVPRPQHPQPIAQHQYAPQQPAPHQGQAPMPAQSQPPAAPQPYAQSQAPQQQELQPFAPQQHAPQQHAPQPAPAPHAQLQPGQWPAPTPGALAPHPQHPPQYQSHHGHAGASMTSAQYPSAPASALAPMAQHHVPEAVPAPATAKTSLLSRLRPNTSEKTPRPASATAVVAANDAPESGFRRGLLMGALGGIVLTFAGMQLLGGGAPEPATVAPAPYPNLTQSDAAAPQTFLDEALPDPAVVTDAARGGR